jgi:hypothetical protein
MAISQILAQAIMQGAQGPDLMGSFERGREKGIQRETRNLAGKAFAGEEGAIKQLGMLNPEAALAMQNALGARDQNNLKIMFQDAAMAKNLTGSSLQQHLINSAKRAMERGDDASKIIGLSQLPEAEIKSQLSQLAKSGQDLGILAKPSGPTKVGKDDRLVSNTGEVILDVTQGDSGTWGGSSEFAQVSNILEKGVDNPEFRKSPAYARAWQSINEPKIARTPSGDIIMRPEVAGIFKPPIGKLDKPITPTEEAKAGLTPSEPGDAKKSIYVPGTEKFSVDQKDYNKDFVILKKSYDSMKNYIDNLRELGPQMSIGPLNAVDTQRLSSSYKRAMLDAKETNNLGVINGPDLTIMEGFLGNPIGAAAIAKGSEALIVAAEQGLKQITDNHGSLNGIFDGSSVNQKELGPIEEPSVTVDNIQRRATVNGKVWSFPDEESFNAYKQAAGIE